MHNVYACNLLILVDFSSIVYMNVSVTIVTTMHCMVSLQQLSFFLSYTKLQNFCEHYFFFCRSVVFFWCYCSSLL